MVPLPDVSRLAAEVRSFLEPALPLLLGAGRAAGEAVAGKLGEEGLERARRLWRRLRPEKEWQRESLETVARALAEEDDDEARRSFEQQVEGLLRGREGLAEEVAGILRAAGRTIHARVEGSGGVAVDGGVAGGERSIVLGRDNAGNVIQINSLAMPAEAAELLRSILRAEPPEDLEEATRRYLDFLVGRYRNLDIRGMGVDPRLPVALPLLELYVPLRARREAPEGETWARELRLAGRAPDEDEEAAIGRRLSEPLPMLDAVAESDGLVLLGDPGAGKTTFLKVLALVLGTGQGERLGLGERLPILVPLSAYAAVLEEEGDRPLDGFFAAYYEKQGVKLPLGRLVDEALEAGRALLLLDGLDEIRDLRRRRLVVDRIETFFTFHRKKGNKFVLTSRIVGYPEVRPTADGLVEATLVDFDDEEIRAFVGKWTRAVERAAVGAGRAAEVEAEREEAELLEALEGTPGARRLASNPLLLTILALMKRQGVALPEHRAALYETCVSALLYNWNLARGLDRRAVAGLNVRETVKVLAPLALWMHREAPGRGLVAESRLRDELERQLREAGEEEPEARAEAFLADVRQHSGLLVERGEGRYGFIHLTFLEYLAAVAIAQRGQREIDPVVDILAGHVGDESWHEVSLLTVGYLGVVQERDEAASAVLEKLLERRPGGAGEAAIFAGEAVADVWPGGVTAECRRRVQDALAAVVTAGEEPGAAVRVKAGAVLGRVGDRRPGVATVDGLEVAGWLRDRSGWGPPRRMGQRLRTRSPETGWTCRTGSGSAATP